MTTPPAREIIRIGRVEVSFLLEGKDTGGQLAVFEFTVPVGAKVPVPHYHKAYDETIYGLKGTLTFTVEGKQIDITPGTTHFIPRGAVHGFKNLAQEDAAALAIVTPGILTPDFFREAAALLNSGGPPDAEKLKQVLLKHGLVPVMPKDG